MLCHRKRNASSLERICVTGLAKRQQPTLLERSRYSYRLQHREFRFALFVGSLQKIKIGRVSTAH